MSRGVLVDRLDVLAWSSAASAKALEHVWLVEPDSELARRLVPGRLPVRRHRSRGGKT
jgi:hypothetical protein